MIVIKYLHLLELFNNVRVLKSVVMKKLNEFCCRVGWGGGGHGETKHVFEAPGCYVMLLPEFLST